MLGRVIFVVWAAILSAQCKLAPEGYLQSVRSANDGVKIAANYIGAVRCRAQLQAQGRDAAEIEKIIRGNASLVSHKLNGKDGELITKQFKRVRNKPNARLSGDRVVGRDSKAQFAVEDIEANCRRLVLSIDSHSQPQLVMKRGFVAAAQQQLFTENFGEQGYGTLQCDGNLCTFSNIRGRGNSTRYFALIEPARGREHIEMAIGYYPHNSTDLVNMDKIELEHIYFRDDSRYQDLPQVTPAHHPRDPHHDYVSDLYVRYHRGDNLSKLPDDTQVLVSLQLRDEQGTVRRRHLAQPGIDMHSHQHEAIFKVKDICRDFIRQDCGAHLQKFDTLLLSMNAELVFSFTRQRQQEIFTHRQALTPELLGKLTRRQGEFEVVGEGWTMWFVFSAMTRSQLQLYFAWQRGQGVPPRSLYIDPRLDCGHQTGSHAVKNKHYYLMMRGDPRHDGSTQYALLDIDLNDMLSHFRNQKCLQPSARGKSAMQFLQALSPTLVFHNRTHHTHNIDREVARAAPHSAWRYQLSDADIEAWLAARGGITVAPTRRQSDKTPVLAVGFQDRR